MSNIKIGRKQKHHIDSRTGEPVVGLTRRPDGRWRVIGTHQTFREPDEAKAIERFKGLTSQEVKVTSDTHGDAPQGNAFEQLSWLADKIGEKLLWETIGQQILDKPQWAARMSGIEWLAYGPTLAKPKPLPTFKELETLWEQNAQTLPEERRKVLADWRYFVNETKIAGLRDITTEVVVAFRNAVYQRKLGGKRQSHLFNRAHRMLTFAQSQAVAVKACEEALIAMRLLTPNDTTVTVDPQPIERADFQLLLDKAEGDDKARLLLCLNAALHVQEALDLKWEDIDNGCLIAHRKKKGKFLRIAPLWQETIEALGTIKRRGEYIFYAEQTGEPLGEAGASRRFRILRKAAGVEHVKADQIRDGAATAAAPVDDKLFNLLMGHRNPGVKDLYAKRNPLMVKVAVQAVYDVYMSPKSE